jgi:hypothetical protein
MKVVLISLLSVVSGVCHSQHWFLRVKPMIGTPIASFQRFDKVVYDPVINYSNGNKPSNISITDNVELRLQYNIELFADFYQINPKWKIGAGFGVYNGARAFLKVNSNEQNSKQIWLDEIVLGNAQNASSGSIGPVDFNMYSLVTRNIEAKINGRENLEYYLSIGAGFTKNKKNDRSWENEGIWIYETYKSHNYFPFLLLRYELEFLTKKGGNLFNCSITYQQGIYKVGKFTHFDIYDQGSFEYQQSNSRGSSIGVSISKPFYLKRPKQLTKVT